MALVEDLRYRLGEVDALAVAAEERLHHSPLHLPPEGRRDMDRASYLLSLVVSRSEDAIEFAEQGLRAVLSVRVRDPQAQSRPNEFRETRQQHARRTAKVSR